MNAISISPLLTNKYGETKPHVLMGGGIPAREAALNKVHNKNI